MNYYTPRYALTLCLGKKDFFFPKIYFNQYTIDFYYANLFLSSDFEKEFSDNEKENDLMKVFDDSDGFYVPFNNGIVNKWAKLVDKHCTHKITIPQTNTNYQILWDKNEYYNFLNRYNELEVLNSLLIPKAEIKSINKMEFIYNESNNC